MMKHLIKALKEISNPRRPFPRRRKRRLSPHRRKMGGMWNLKPFVTRPNRKRASAVIKLRNKLRMRKHVFGGRFIGDSDIVNQKRPVLYQQEAFVYFPGTDKRGLWNAHIITARQAFWNEIGSMAFDRVWAMMPKKEKKKTFSRILNLCYSMHGGRPRHTVCERETRHMENLAV